jgi:hypothetical protein
MKGFNATRLIIAALLLVFCGIALQVNHTVNAQTSARFPDVDKNGKPLIPRPNPFIMYSPTDLAHNATPLPISGATAPTNIIPTGGATALTYFVNCTQPTKVSMQVYTADDLASPQALNPAPGTGYSPYAAAPGYDIVTANTLLAGPQQVYIGTELAPTVTSGTLSLPVRLPQAAVSFTETNGTATAGTCTGRLLVKYN